jgi:hypothetical protein
MIVTQADKAKKFRALHEAPGAFVVANVWDGGSARMIGRNRVQGLATSSGASAGLLGRRDGQVTRDEAMAQARVICEASDLPVSADLIGMQTLAEPFVPRNGGFDQFPGADPPLAQTAPDLDKREGKRIARHGHLLRRQTREN